MTRGRKPKAIEVQEASGAYIKDPQRRPTNPIKADKRPPNPPAVVKNDPCALEVWNETVEVLRESGILSKTDTHLLTQYVIVYSEWVKVSKHVAQHGHTDDNGRTSPESTAFFKLAAQHAKLLPELGLSPSSRARLSTATSDHNPKEKQDLAAFINAMKNT